MKARVQLSNNRTHVNARRRRAPRGDAYRVPLNIERARGMPGAQCTRSLVRAGVVKHAHEYSQRRHRKHPAFPTRWFYGFLRAL